MIIIMTMTMTEIIDLETGIDHTIEIDHIVEIDYETTIKMITKIIIEITIKMIIGMIIEMITETTIEMTIEMTTEMTVEKKIIGISKNRNIRESTAIFLKTHMKTGTRRIIEMVIKTKKEIKANTNTEMTVTTK